MPIDFFHLIADPDSAEVRRFLVAYDLTGDVNFRNITYDSHSEVLKNASGALTVPALIVEGGQVVTGKAEVLAYLKNHHSRKR